MTQQTLARDTLWHIADVQHGYVTTRQARDSHISPQAVQMLVHRGTLLRVAHGVYRFPKYPVGERDQEMLAVLWARVPEAALSHESALDVYDLCDVNPDQIHITVAKHRRFRRSQDRGYAVHFEDLQPHQIGWVDEIPTVQSGIAIAQCIASGTPAYLLRQALENGYTRGHLKSDEHHALRQALEQRDERATSGLETR